MILCQLQHGHKSALAAPSSVQSSNWGRTPKYFNVPWDGDIITTEKTVLMRTEILNCHIIGWRQLHARIWSSFLLGILSSLSPCRVTDPSQMPSGCLRTLHSVWTWISKGELCNIEGVCFFVFFWIQLFNLLACESMFVFHSVVTSAQCIQELMKPSWGQRWIRGTGIKAFVLVPNQCAWFLLANLFATKCCGLFLILAFFILHSSQVQLNTVLSMSLFYLSS